MSIIAKNPSCGKLKNPKGHYNAMRRQLLELVVSQETDMPQILNGLAGCYVNKQPVKNEFPLL